VALNTAVPDRKDHDRALTEDHSDGELIRLVEVSKI